MMLTRSFSLILSALIILSVPQSYAMTADRAVVDVITEMYRLDAPMYEVEVLGNSLKSADIAKGEVTLRPLTTKEPLGLFLVLATVTRDNEEIEKGQVRLRIRKYQDVLVSAEPLRRHQQLAATQVESRRMEVTTLRERPLSEPGMLSGLRLKRNLKKGTILTSTAFEMIPDLERGREISIVYVDGLCQISTSGIVMQPGMTGDYIKVKNKKSGKIILARIVDNSSVAVDP